MANKTVKLTSYIYNGRTGLTLLLLHPETGAIGNGAGDTLTAGPNGLFTTTVTEAITGYWRIVVLDGSVPLIEDEWVRFKADVEGVYIAGNPKDMADNVYMLPTKGTPSDNRPTTSTLYARTNESFLVVRTVTDAAKALVDLSGRTLRFIAEAESGLDKIVIESADITISGTGDATYSLKIPKTAMTKARTLACALRDVSDTDDNNGLDFFDIVVKYAPDVSVG